ncbi:Uncharacterised protein [Klebsiella pneumoniae]|nr:Uncharacterised protein [Pseudomonas aeruginosa]SVJ79099.1 Uncharacterised protein [Klebsiella pneumoniae]VFT20133.1 Uncharacterised protein [Pseudomonas aeruginosa]
MDTGATFGLAKFDSRRQNGCSRTASSLLRCTAFLLMPM